MPLRIEAYTVDGAVEGVIARSGHFRDVLEGSPELEVERATWLPLDGSAARPAGEMRLMTDDMLLAVGGDEPHGPAHAAWHPIRLEAGPYLIEGELPTMPGFDPGRALMRPTGTFVVLRDVRVSLLDQPEAGAVEHPEALVNRYTVDRVDADLMLGFFFPGAHIDVPVAPGSAPTGADADQAGEASPA